jgi:2-polyprenyl-3-methyl-5-hydroxy-6-metoxy-1,4-benzoquinol methylase
MNLYQLYQERYRGEMRFKTSPKGLHSAIVAQLAPILPGRTVLDIGCGAGRLALFCAMHGARVTAIDFSEGAIDLARLIVQELTVPPRDLVFRVDRFEEVEGQYDVVLLTEVFEHIEQEPSVTLKRLREFVTSDGTIVISCPNFVNFRGAVWMTLQHIFGFLMSPSDVHFIFPWQMEAWCDNAGLRVEKHFGLFHNWGWGDWCAADMKQRIEYALRDQRKSDANWEVIGADLDRMGAYLNAQAAFFERILEKDVVPLLCEVPANGWGDSLVLRDELAATDLGKEIQDYLADARVRYADGPPLNALGATSLYFCRPI